MTDNAESAVERYERWKATGEETGGTQQEADEWPYKALELADAALAGLKAERDELRDENADLRLSLTTSGLLTRMQEANQNGYECGRSLAEAERFMLEKERNELKAENERLRQFCYECEHLDGWAWCREMSLDEQREHDKRGERDHCHFKPSRWQARAGLGRE